MYARTRKRLFWLIAICAVIAASSAVIVILQRRDPEAAAPLNDNEFGFGVTSADASLIHDVTPGMTKMEVQEHFNSFLYHQFTIEHEGTEYIGYNLPVGKIYNVLYFVFTDDQLLKIVAKPQFIFRGFRHPQEGYKVSVLDLSNPGELAVGRIEAPPFSDEEIDSVIKTAQPASGDHWTIPPYLVS